ncbi:MAG: ABC-F family ATP-binding cassette domain-containing protein [Pseudomonadota bacterium]
MSSIHLRNVGFEYDAPYKSVFNDLNLVIDTLWRTGLVGRNGQGKSTLLGLLSGRLTPNSGHIEISERTLYFPARVSEPSLDVRTVISNAVAPFIDWALEMSACIERGKPDDLERYAVLQEQYQLLGGYEIVANIEREWATIGMARDLLDRPFETLSGGERTRALLIALFVTGGVFPLIDEPTNHLDAEGRAQVADYLASKDGFLLVSHDRDFLDRAIDHVVAINKSDIVVNRGNYSLWRKHMNEVELHETRTRDNIKREVRQLKRAAQQRRQGSASREAEKYKSAYANPPAMIDRGHVGRTAAKQMKRALATERRIDKRLDEKETLLRNQEKGYELKIQTLDGGREQLLVANNLQFGYDDRAIIDNVSLGVSQGDRIAVSGRNGSGKSTLLKLLAGELTCDSGVIAKPAHVSVSRAYQHPIWQSGDLRVWLREGGLEESRFRQIMGSFGVAGEVFDRPLETFSQGQLKKVDLTRSMLTDADILIWDEPLNYIDVLSREQIETAIVDSGPTMIFVEHDGRFVDNIATELIEL